jgi:hypothetical protein
VAIWKSNYEPNVNRAGFCVTASGVVSELVLMSGLVKTADASYLFIAVGDHLSQISSAVNPSDSTIPEVDTPTQLMASMRDQLFKLAHQVELERQAKVDALANVAGLEVRLQAMHPTGAEIRHIDSKNAGRSVSASAEVKQNFRGFKLPRTPAWLQATPPVFHQPNDGPFDVLSSSDHSDSTRPSAVANTLLPVVQPAMDFRSSCGLCIGDVIEL